MDDRVTVILTGRRPVRVRKDAWPVVAYAEDHDGQVRSQADRVWRLVVRQHADGRALVYGVFQSSWANEHDRRGGVLVPAGGDVPAAIHQVADDLGLGERLAEEAIADLPAEDLD